MSTLDELGARFKEEYESATRLVLPRHTHTILRLDGNAFHTYTRGLPKPFDETLHEDLVNAAAFLVARIQGAKLAYVQSDEVSVLITDFENPGTQPWFAGNVQKMTSVSASILTAKFNDLRSLGFGDVGEQLAFFDSRAFAIADAADVATYFAWRRQDAWRNAVYSAARAHYPHKQLHGLNGVNQLRLLQAAGVDWVTAYPDQFKIGTVIYRAERVEDVTYTHSTTGQELVARDVKRHFWEAVPAVHDVFVAHLEPCLLR